MTTKKLSEETDHKPSEPHSLAVPFKVYLYGAINHIQVAMRNTQWMFMGGYLHYIYVFYCFLPSIGQLAMPNFLSNICLQYCQQKNKEKT